MLINTEALAAWLQRCYLYWTDRPRWRLNRCRAGLHDLLLNFHDDSHYTAYCQWCPYRNEGEVSEVSEVGGE